jgi:hypothetical protein
MTELCAYPDSPMGSVRLGDSGITDRGDGMQTGEVTRAGKRLEVGTAGSDSSVAV